MKKMTKIIKCNFFINIFVYDDDDGKGTDFKSLGARQ